MAPSQLTIDEYVAMTYGLPRPTERQMEEFARFVSAAHSWYKHLPTLPPGVPFHFFLDPFAGMQHVVAFDGSLRIEERVETGFHYSWIPTQEYRTRFGHLAFCRSAGSRVSLNVSPGERLIPSDDHAAVYDPIIAHMRSLPDRVLQAGTTWVSGIVHVLAADTHLWRYLLRETCLPSWPAESGGTKTLEEIIERCRVLIADPSKEHRLSGEERSSSTDEAVRQDYDFSCVDWPLCKLIEPERKRQQRNMVEAMKRMLDVIADVRASHRAVPPA